MAKTSANWIILTVVLILGVILTPIVVDQIQSTEQEISIIKKTVTLYPSSDSVLGLTQGTGTASKETTSTDVHWVSTHALTLSDLNVDIQKLLGKTLTIYANVSLSNSNVALKVIGNFTIIKSDWSERQYIGKAESEVLTGDTDWHVLAWTFDFPEYTVVDKTDKLKFEYWVNVTTPQSASQVTIDFAGSKIENFGYQYYNVNEGWGFTGGPGARTLFMLLPFIFIVGIIVYFIASLLGKI